MVSGFVDIRLFLTGVPSMMKIDVAPVSAIASDAAMAIALRYCGFSAPNISLAVAAIDLLVGACLLCTVVASCVQFDVTIVLSSSSIAAATFIIWVGSEVLA